MSVLTLHRTYYLVDIPLLYALLLLVSPLALVMLSQGRTGVVLGVSWLLWAVYQFFPEHAEAPWPIAGDYLFILSAWQVFFFTGLALGWHHTALTHQLASFPRRLALGVSGAAFAALIVLYQGLDRLPHFWDPEQAVEVQLFFLEVVFGKADVRPGRVVASIVIFAFFYLLATQAWRPVHRGLGWLLLPLGQSALYAYAAHVVLALPVALALDAVAVAERYARPVNAAAQIATVLVIWLLIRRHFLFASPSIGRSSYAWALGAVFACLILLPFDPTPSMPGLASAAPEADPYASRVARAFGTPVPGKPPRAETAVPLPRPRLQLPLGPFARAEPRASEYVGTIRGGFRNLMFFSPSLDRDMPYFIYLPPGYESEGRIEEFVASRAGWIRRRRADWAGIERLPRNFETGEVLNYLGNSIQLRLVDGARSTATARLASGWIEVALPLHDEGPRRPIVATALEAWYRVQADVDLCERVARYAGMAGLPVPPVLVRAQVRRWGSCSASGVLRFNWRLIMAPPEVVDYVVVHELCHLRHPHHQKPFWEAVAALMPDYHSRRARLLREGATYRL